MKRKHSRKQQSPIMLLVLLISAVGLSIALGNTSATQGTTGAVSSAVIPAQQSPSAPTANTPVALQSCATNIPCDNTFAGTRQCQTASDRYAQQGVPNAMNCVNHCCIITPR